jgi:hypothetical protein
LLPSRTAAAAVALALLLPALAGAQDDGAKRGPSTPAERKRAVAVTRRLERDPLGKGADADRKWLLRWIVEIPDIMVTSCAGPLDALRDDRGDRHGSELYVQSVFGMAAFLIENPKKKDDEVAVQTAGIESVLAAYRSILKKEPKARWPELDDLLAAQKKGTLPKVVKDEVDCKPQTEPTPPVDETI